MKMEAMFRNKTFSSSTQENIKFKYLFSYDVIIITESGNKSKKNHVSQGVSTCMYNTYGLKIRYFFFATHRSRHKHGNLIPTLISLLVLIAKAPRPIRRRISNIKMLIIEIADVYSGIETESAAGYNKNSLYLKSADEQWHHITHNSINKNISKRVYLTSKPRRIKLFASCLCKKYLKK